MDEGSLLPPIPYAMHTKLKSLHFHGMFLPKKHKSSGNLLLSQKNIVISQKIKNK